jgi:hypothetical protein
MKSLNKFLRKLIIPGVLLFAIISVQAQTPENTNIKGSGKVKFAIKPNSRDEKVVMRDNTLKRIDKQRKQAVIQKMQQMRQKRMMIMLQKDKVRRSETIQRRKLMMQRRQNLRK